MSRSPLARPAVIISRSVLYRLFEPLGGVAHYVQQRRLLQSFHTLVNPTSRRFLSEPPLDYRVPAADAPVGDTGEDEWKKERRLKAASRKASGTKSWRDYIPGF